MSKKWIVTTIIVMVVLLFAGMTEAEAASPLLSPQNPWDGGYYNQPDWNVSNYNWDCNNYGGCQTYNNCSYGNCYSNQWMNVCNRAEFVQDVTFSDGTYIAPGNYFTKTWRIRNTGTCAWNSGYRLVFTSGDPMSGSQAISLPGYVASGQTVDISANLIAPNTVGTFRGNWMLQSPDGTTFGVGPTGQIPIWVNISTWQNNCYCVGTYNCNCIKPCYGISCSPQAQSHQTGRNPFCNNKIRAINDVTVPDGEIFTPNTYFRKTWRMKNGGTCVWDESYTVIFTGGDSMSGAEYIHLPKKVYPGEYVEVSVDLRSPANPGLYRAYYMLQDNLGYSFGYGSYANTAFWAEVQVRAEASPAPAASVPSEVLPAATDTTALPAAVVPEIVVPEASASETPTAISEEAAPVETTIPVTVDTGVQAVEEAAPAVMNACGTQHIEVDHSIEDTYNITWYVANAGTSAWDSKTYSLISAGISDNLYLISNTIVIPDTQPGDEAKVEFTAKVWDQTDTTSKPWMKFYMSNGSESFCDVYFDLQN
ncbi:MAG: NBR1-Ig-like domain-containing protein [Flexilinea sp.]